MSSRSKAQAEWAKSDRGLKALGAERQRAWLNSDSESGVDHLPDRSAGKRSEGGKQRYKPLGELNFTSHRGRK